MKNSYRYDPFGNSLSASETVPNLFRFDGAVYDASAKLYHMGERLYDPAVARWTKLDRFAGFQGDPQSLNRYAFVEGDPVLFVDPYGLCESWSQCRILSGYWLGGSRDASPFLFSG